jgi:hypothetical protein
MEIFHPTIVEDNTDLPHIVEPPNYLFILMNRDI